MTIFHRHCPRLGKKYQTDRGGMKVLRANMFLALPVRDHGK